ncbi:MAG: hypothetical protein R3A51_12540 [Nannocystaceae bacterium]
MNKRATAPLLALVGLIASSACGPSPGLTTTAESTAGSTDTDDNTTSSSDPGTTAGSDDSTSDATTSDATTIMTTPATTDTGVETTDATTDVTTTDPSTTEPSTDTEGFECMAPKEVEIGFELTPQVDALDEECVVLEETAEEGAYTVVMACVVEVYTLTLTSSPPLPPPSGLTLDEPVRLTYVSASDGRWLTLKQAGEVFGASTVMGLVSASTLDPPGMTISEFFEAPTVELVGGCAPIDDFCGPLERLGLVFTVEPLGSSYPIFDHDHGLFGVDFVSHYAVDVERAGDLPTDACPEPKPTWFEFGFTWIFTGP